MGYFRDRALRQEAMRMIDERLERMRVDFNKILEQSENFNLSDNSKQVETMAFDGFLDLFEMRNKLKPVD